MAKDCSFDVFAKVNLTEVKNAVDQASKEMIGRYDFKGTKSTIELNQKDEEISILADDDYKLQSIRDILESKMAKRGISLKALEYLREEDASGGMKRQKVKIQSGIPLEKCKDIVKLIKNSKVKVQSSIQGDLVRVVGKSKDELQEVMQLLKTEDFGVFIEFGNYR
ncbi:MAG TPA: YajQ family cyclic di-GMP-binding protein [Spirochaetia bacterium]|nr:MAG: YajQ family cyclic di-GMP-binding protein [Spirochaetes bacterium GWB1_36_13]HCL56813.1 YajQ family cyclic di-GMP-binding protein [Spirochaetia bacterium]